LFLQEFVDFQDLPGPAFNLIFQDFPVLENGSRIKIFPGLSRIFRIHMDPATIPLTVSTTCSKTAREDRIPDKYNFVTCP